MLAFFKKIRTEIIYFLKGVLIGIAMIIPGVSGGTLAVILKIYDDLLEAVNGLFRHFVRSVRVLIPVLLGAAVGFIALVFPLKWGLENAPLPVVTLFVGFIIGSLPSLYKNVYKKEKPVPILWGVLFLGLMIGLCFVPSLSQASLDINFKTMALLFLVGVIIACALVAPGISGSMLLMVLGFYQPLLDIISEIVKFQNLGHNIVILIPMAFGVILGFFLISFMMEKLLKKFPVSTYFAILGLIVGSIACIYSKTFLDYTVTINALQISLSVVFFLLGGALSFFIGLKTPDKKEKAEETGHQEDEKENKTNDEISSAEKKEEEDNGQNN